MQIRDFQAIDVHAHFGVYLREESALRSEFITGDMDTVLRRARMANTRLTIVSSSRALTPRFKADPVGGNNETVQSTKGREGILYWVVIDPLTPQTYEQAEEMLSCSQCAGIKIHPEEHGYPISDHGNDIFTFAAQHGAIILTHSGEQNSLPEDFVQYANRYPEVTLILAHHGFCRDRDPSHQVRAIQKSTHGNMFTDTSSSTSTFSRQIEWGVGEIGADKILYGTDSPLYFAPMQRARIDYAEIPDSDKRRILHE